MAKQTLAYCVAKRREALNLCHEYNAGSHRADEPELARAISHAAEDAYTLYQYWDKRVKRLEEEQHRDTN